MSLAIRQVCDGFGLPSDRATAELVARGAMGRIWRLVTACGAFTVKEALWDEGWEDVEEQVRFQAAATAVGVRSPANIPLLRGGYVLDLPAARVRVYSWVDDVSGVASASWLGTVIGRLHGLRWPAEQPPHPWYDTAVDLSPLFRDAAGQPWHRDLMAYADQLAELAACVTPAAGPQLMCHRDLKPDNVLPRADGDNALIDWDNAGPCLPDRELAEAMVHWYAGGGDVDSAAVLDVLTSYRQGGGSAVLRDDSFAMAAAIAVNYVSVQASVALDAALSTADREFAVAELLGTLRSLPAPPAWRKVLRLASAAG
jgi:hypothetical protein